MKKLIAKLCMWILGKLGYEKEYSPKNTIVLTVDTEEAMASVKKLHLEMLKLKGQFK